MVANPSRKTSENVVFWNNADDIYYSVAHCSIKHKYIDGSCGRKKEIKVQSGVWCSVNSQLFRMHFYFHRYMNVDNNVLTRTISSGADGKYSRFCDSTQIGQFRGELIF